MSQTYDGATTSLRRWSKPWKALAKQLRHDRDRVQRNFENVLEGHGRYADALHRRIEESDRRIDELAVIRARLELRIEELEAELGKLREKYDRDISNKEVGYQLELAEAMRSGEVVAGLLATERAAREQAEKDHGEAQNRLYFVERERDTALARALEAEKGLDERDAALVRMQAAETALASARTVIERLVNDRASAGQARG